MNSILNQHVLVLNRLWQAVNVCTARRALTLLFQGQAQVVLDHADGSFQTYNFSAWHDFSQQSPHPESHLLVDMLENLHWLFNIPSERSESPHINSAEEEKHREMVGKFRCDVVK